MKSIKLLALGAMIAPLLFSCSGGGSSSLFGSIPGVYEKYQAEKDELNAEAKNIKTQEDKAKLIQKSEKMEAKYSEKIESAAKGLDGKTIEVADGDLKVTSPLSFEFEKISKSSLAPQFNVNGAIEAAGDIAIESSYFMSSISVYIVGLDAEDQEIYKVKIGKLEAENVDGKSVVKAGTPVIFNTVYYSGSDTEAYKNSKSLKLQAI